MSKIIKVKDNHDINAIMDLYHNNSLCYDELEELSELILKQQSKWLVMYKHIQYIETQVEHYENKIN